MSELRLRDLRRGELRSFRRFTPSALRYWWVQAEWATCPDCGTSPLCPTEPTGATYDGEPLVCMDCGEVGSVSADDGGVWEQWSDEESGEKLCPSALAGLRRLLRYPRSTWWDASGG